MSDQNTLTKVYDVKINGGDAAYQTLAGINKLFIEMKNNKVSLNDLVNVNIDASKIQGISKSFSDLIASNKELIKSIGTLTAEMTKVGQVGQQVASSISAGFSKANGSVTNITSSFAGVQRAMSGSVTGTTDYITILNNLIQRYSSISGQIVKVQAEIGRYEREIKHTQSTMEQYGVALRNNQSLEQKFTSIITENTDKIAVLRVELSQLRSAASEVGSAIEVMNKAQNPALTQEEAEAVAENSVALAKQNEELRQQAIVSGAAFGSMEEMEVILKSMKTDYAALSESERESADAQTKLIEIQTLDAELKRLKSTLTGQNIALTKEETAELMRNKVAASEQNMEMKQQAKLAMAASGSMDALSITLGILRDRYRALSEAERESTAGEMMRANIQRLDAQIKKLDASIGNNQRNVGNYGSAFDKVGSKLQTFIVRDLFRAAASFVVFDLAFQGMQKLWELIPDKIDKSAEAMQQFNDVLTKQIDEFIELQKAQNDYFFSGEDAYKIQVETVKAKGVVDGEVFKAQKEQFEAEQKLRQKQLSDLGEIADKYRQVQDIFLHYDKYGDLNNVHKQLEGLGLSPADLKNYKNQIDEYLEARKKLSEKDQKNFKLSDNTDLFKKQAAIQKQGYELEAAIENAKTEFLAKQAELRYNKNLELDNQLIQIREQRRQEAEKETINSADKITRDISAKYNIMYNDIHKKMTELAKQFPDDKLPADLQDKYDIILSNVRKIEALDKQNQINAFNKAEYYSMLGFNASEAQGRSESGKFSAEHGAPDLDKMSSAIDKEQEAKVQAENKGYEESREQYLQHGRNTEELDREHQARLKQIEMEGYEARVALASKYYERIQEQVSLANDTAVEQIETSTLYKIIGILNGKGSDAKKDKKINKAEQHGIIDAATKNLEGQQRLLDQANKTVANDQATYDSATTPDEKATAGKQLAKDKKTVADLENEVAQLKKQIAEAQNKLDQENKALYDKIKQESIEAFEQIGTAYVQMLDQQQQARERNANNALEFEQKVLNSQVQSNQQKLANERAYMLTKQQMEKERLQEQRKLAEAQMAIDYATAVMKIVAENADNFEALGAVEIAGITAVYAAKLALMNSVQYGQGGDVPTDGGMFGGRSHSAGGTPFLFHGGRFEAEAGELAIINKRSAASNQVMSVTGTPKQIASGINAWGGGYNFAPGAKMHTYEWGGSLGSQLEPPAFINDYYTRKSMASYQSAGMEGMIWENNRGLLQAHQHLLELNVNLQRHADAINGRIDRLEVSLDHRKVTAAQNQHTKLVRVGNHGNRSVN